MIVSTQPIRPVDMSVVWRQAHRARGALFRLYRRKLRLGARRMLLGLSQRAGADLPSHLPSHLPSRAGAVRDCASQS
jgi:hypothetical protein